MSRVGKRPVPIPAGVEVNIDGKRMEVKGPKGLLVRDLHHDIVVRRENDTLLVERPTDHRQHRSLHGLTRSLVANMIHGVTEGFQQALELKGTGYRASKSGDKLVLNIGYSHPVEIEPAEGTEIEVLNPTSVVVRGTDNQKVGQLAAEIRAVRPPEPYLGKGIRYAGERVRRKEGKKAK